MRKALTILLVFLLLVGHASATSIDLDSFTREELVQLYSEIGKRLAEYSDKDMLSAFADALTSAGYTYKTTEPWYTMVGAVDGMKYHIGGYTAEVYIFDMSSTAYITAVESGSLLGNAMPGVVINDGAILYMQDCEIKDAIIDIFEGL